METKKLFEQLSNIYQASQVLKNLQVAYYMHDLPSCETLIAFYRKLHEDKVADELYYWCQEDCEEGLLDRLEKEHYRLCQHFGDICREMNARFEVGGEAWNEELLTVFAKVFFALGHNLQMHDALKHFVEISADFWMKLNPDAYEVLSPIFREAMGYSSLSVFLVDLMSRLEHINCSEEQRYEIMTAFGVFVTRFVFKQSENEQAADDD